jgi:hypothetical protein
LLTVVVSTSAKAHALAFDPASAEIARNFFFFVVVVVMSLRLL